MAHRLGQRQPVFRLADLTAIKQVETSGHAARTAGELLGQGGKAAYIELKPASGGNFYTINTVFPVGENYAEHKKGWKLLWSGASVPTVASGANPLAEMPVRRPR